MEHTLRIDGATITDDGTLDLTGISSTDWSNCDAWNAFLAVIAPAVPRGCYIEFDHGARPFRVEFTGTEVREVYPTITWPDLAEEQGDHATPARRTTHELTEGQPA